MKFEKYKISDELKRNLTEAGFYRPTDIQFKTIPSILAGEDVLAIAQTGTGKTAAFAIPVIDKIHRKKTSSRTDGIKCIVMAPTRELAQQIGQVFGSLAKHTKVKIFSLYGGVEQEEQIRRLEKGIDILVTTPGRMFDLINQKAISLDAVSTLILDEADHMLKLGFIKDIEYIKMMLRQKHQTLFFSATINEEIKKLAYSQVKSSAVRIQISPKDPVSKNVSHYVMNVEMDDKRFFLERFINDHPDSRIIVFARTKVRVDRVAKAMERAEIKVATIHSDHDQDERRAVLASFKDGKEQILIATDLTARGIDIPDVNFVINYDLPQITENYVHRVGRTGRGFKKGDAISFCSKEEKELLKEIEEFLGKKIEVIQVGKNEYEMTLNGPKKETSAEDVLRLFDEGISKKRKKKKKK
jgi:ATP-dependent RNA helicase RhlE